MGLEVSIQSVDRIINYFYDDILDPYWDKRRALIDEKYQTIPFPLKRYETPTFVMNADWTLEHYFNYIGKTWSSVQTYKQRNGTNPLDLIRDDLKQAWGPTHIMKITWPIYLLLGKYKE